MSHLLLRFNQFLEDPANNEFHICPWSFTGSLFNYLIETEHYEIAERLLDKKPPHLMPVTLLKAIEVKMRVKKFQEANRFYDLIFKKNTTIKNNLSVLNGMAALKFQLEDNEKAHTYLMKYWKRKGWHSHIFSGTNSHKWAMDRADAFKNEEFKTLIEWIMAIKDKLNDQEGVEWFRNLLRLIHINLADIPAVIAAHQDWEAKGFYQQNLQPENCLPPQLFQKTLLVQRISLELRMRHLRSLIDKTLTSPHFPPIIQKETLPSSQMGNKEHDRDSSSGGKDEWS